MAAPSSVSSKHPSGVLAIGFDWADELGQSTISASEWTIPSGITADSTSNDSTTTTVVLSGGTSGTDYDLVNVITASDGQKHVGILRIFVGSLPTADDVKALIDTSVTNVQPYILAAHLIVQGRLKGKGVSDALVKEITRWIAAHFLAMREERGGLASSETGDAKDVYTISGMFAVGMGLNLSRYGQQAITLDPTGILRTSSAPRAKFGAF